MELCRSHCRMHSHDLRKVSPSDRALGVRWKRNCCPHFGQNSQHRPIVGSW